MPNKKKVSAEEQNITLWLERQNGVTSVVQAHRTTTKHRHPIGHINVVREIPTGVSLRLYLKGACRDFFVHCKPDMNRVAWLRQLGNGNAIRIAANVQNFASRTLRHTVEKAQNFSPNVPAPKPVDDGAGQVFRVTPELAAKWLERNTRNRPLRQDVVFKYAADMQEKKWMITGDAIAFDTNGAVVNGQHRLWAVLESGVAVDMLVAFDLDPDVVFVLDDHLKRNLTDIVRIGTPGSTVTNTIASVSRMMMLRGGRAGDVLRRTSRQKQIEFLERHMEAINFAWRDCFHSTNRRALTSSPITAVIARAYYTQDCERLKAFAKVLVEGFQEKRGDDDAAVLLRNWLMKLSAQGVRPQPDLIYHKTERALWLFLRRETTRNLTEASTELFLLPEETLPAKEEGLRRA